MMLKKPIKQNEINNSFQIQDVIPYGYMQHFKGSRMFTMPLQILASWSDWQY